jgi:hypothetical protein
LRAASVSPENISGSDSKIFLSIARAMSCWKAIQSKRGFRYEVLPMLCAKF